MKPQSRDQYKLEIANRLGLEPERVHFHFKEEGELTSLDITTVNPRHEMQFLYHSVKGVDEMDALEKMYSYVTKHHLEENSYTVQWTSEGESELQTSYFRAKNLYELLDKFFYNRSIASCRIFSINLNPVS